MRDALTFNSAVERLALEAEQAQEEIILRRLANEARFGTPIGECPYGCDGGGWNPLPGYAEPDGMDISWRGGWWTACGCNVASTWRRGVQYRWIRRYPNGYTGERIEPPDLAA